ncbi:PAS domain S-box protein [Ktedonobacter racemifer]|uniref:histidine kinase n=1 Tax=Ktedonobacter racemifer DSM 44963 TaxID=485913 RepID=D6U2X0_KTERA|nr:PAS domain S-box protein [Ktedonobacter racemifer]EFH82875.1 PAS/PAC sensor signal transduction histidine kinase [Ktedonobacter racemifer DSM 44963]
MSKTKRTERLTPASSETLLHMLKTLPDALFLVNDAETIKYVNTSAQTMTGSSREALLGNSFWHGAPQLLSPSLYQAMRKTRQTQEPTEVEYWSPMTRNWLRAQLTPTVEGLTLQFHQMRAPTPTPRQETFPQGERLCIDDLDGLHTRIGILTPEGIVLDINAVPLDDAQVRREEVIGKPLAETPWWSFAPASQEQLRAAIARANAGETVCFEALVRPREGMLLSFESVITPHLNADHHIEYLVIAGIDITARKRAERDIHALIDAIPQLVWTGRPDGYVDSYNQRWRDYTGLTTEEAQGDGWMQCTHPEDRQRVLEVWQRAVETGEPYETEQRLRHGTTGEYRWFLMQATPYTDAQGTILKYVGTCTDIHDKKRAEAELRALIDAIPQLVWILGPDGSSEYGNQRWCDYTNMSFEQYQGDGWLQAIHPDDYQHTLTLWRHALETGEPFEIEYRLKNGKTGGYRWFLARALPVRDEAGQILKWFGTCTDIHEKKQIEDDIRVLVDAIPQFVWIMHPDGSAEYANPRWCEYTGMTSQQYQGDGWLQAIHPDDQQRVLAGWQSAVQAGRPYEGEQRLRNSTTGDYRWFLARGAPFKDAQGTILKYFGTSTDIDEQKQAEQRIKASEENWRVLAETVPQMVWTTRPNGQHEYVNQRWCDYMGVTVEHMQSDRWAPLSFIHPDDREGTRALWLHALETGAMYEHEERFRNSQTGAYRWFLARAMPVRDGAGQILKWFGTSTDIEDQKRIEQQLKESEENWRVLAETVPQLVWTIQPDGRLDYCNQRYYDYIGASPEQLLGYGWSQFLHPDDAERTLALRRHLLETGEAYEIKYRLREGNTGNYRWFLARAMPVRDETGQILKWFGTSTDIEDQKRIEQQLKESEENWRVLAETVPQLVMVARSDGQHEYVNQRWRDYTGFTVEQTQSDLWAYLQFIHPDDREGARALSQHAQETGAMYEHEERLRNSQTGAYRWFLTRGVPVRDETGQIVKWFGTCTDIDEQKRTEEALRQSQKRASVLMNSSIIGIFVAEDEQVVDANDTFLRMTGYTGEDLRERRMSWRHMTPPEYLARTQQAYEELATQQSIIPYEKEYVCKDGSRLPVLVGAVVLQHHPFQGIAFVLDNSARKELEQRKDDFISMASHELRNPLAALKMQTQLVRKRLERQSHHEAATALAKVEGPVKRLERLIGELLDVSKIQAGRLEYLQETVDLDALLHEVADTMQQIQTTHTIVVRGAAPRSLVGDKDRLGQIFTNLISNAIKYSPGAETVEIDMSASPETVTIRVRDYGLGIPREQRDKIFERFYRATGPKQKAIPGLGMGLYIVAEIIKRHGGTITVESEVGKGSIFTVTLPKRRDV